MKERPVLMSAPMVKAILQRRKRVTRRAMKPQPPDWIDSFGYTAFTPKGSISGRGYWRGVPGEEGPGEKYFKSPHGMRGDRLWLRETFALECDHEYIYEDGYKLPTDGRPIQINYDDIGDGNAVKYHTIPRYRATEPDTLLILRERELPEDCMVWTPSIFMPRWASRITLEIEEVKVQRLQEMTAIDAIDEGVMTLDGDWIAKHFPAYTSEYETWKRLNLTNVAPPLGPGPLQRFKALWESINGKNSWDINPWIWAVSFNVLDASK